MNKFYLMLALLSFASSSLAQIKPCEELKREIEAKIQANGVPEYTLEIADKGDDHGLKIVGSCDGGQRIIVYQRDAPHPAHGPRGKGGRGQ